MSAAIILHHDDPTHAVAVAEGEWITNPADLLPGDVLLSRWAPGRYLTVTAPARHFCGYLAVEYETEDGKCGTLNVRADVNPFARRPVTFTQAERAKAQRYGLPNHSNADVAEYLLRLSNDATSYAATAALVEAAARLDAATYTAWAAR